MGAALHGAQLQTANISHAELDEANLMGAQLQDANLHRACLVRASLMGANLARADLSNTLLNAAAFHQANLSEANLDGAYLIGTQFLATNLRGANLTNCSIFGVSVWEVDLEGANQLNLIINNPGKSESAITTDNLEVAQFIYLLLNNEKIRQTIDAITSKFVLILGRFTPERKSILDAIRVELRTRNYLPILFDFDKPTTRDIEETVSTLAHMARFVVADITDPRSIPQELARIVPNLPSLPIQPLLQASASEYGMFEHFQRYPWVLPIYRYTNIDDLLDNIVVKIINPAEKRIAHTGN